MSKIVVCHCNRPNFLEIQLQSYFKTCEDLEEIIVVNDGSSLSLRNEIKNKTITRKNVRLIDAPYDLDHSSPPFACSSVLQWIYDLLLMEDEKSKVAFLDSDMFPLKKFSIENFLQEKSIAGLKQIRGNVDYIWNGIVMIDFNKIQHPHAIDWNCGVINCYNVDCGGQFFNYFEKYGRDDVRYLTHTSHMSIDQINSLSSCPGEVAQKYDVSYKMEVFEDTFLHYGRASNWETSWLSPIDFNKSKTDYTVYWLQKNGVL